MQLYREHDSFLFQYYTGTLYELFPFTSCFGIFRISIKTLGLGLVLRLGSLFMYFFTAHPLVYSKLRKNVDYWPKT